MLVDTHAHLEIFPRDSTASNDLSHILTRANAAGVSKIITIGTTLDSCRDAIEIAEKKSTGDLEIWSSCGLHPTDSREEFTTEEHFGSKINKLKDLLGSSKKIIAVGECGLDYYLEDETTNKKMVTTGDDKKFQRKLFVAQIKLARELDLPLIVHCRNGWDEVFEIISNFQTPSSKIRGVFHSFTGGASEMKKAINLGFSISFSGIVTFKNAVKVQEAAKLAPMDKILVETDAPFLAPEPLRGQNNESKNVKITASFLAKLKDVPEEIFFNKTSENAEKLFNI